MRIADELAQGGIPALTMLEFQDGMTVEREKVATIVHEARDSCQAGIICIDLKEVCNLAFLDPKCTHMEGSAALSLPPFASQLFEMRQVDGTQSAIIVTVRGVTDDFAMLSGDLFSKVTPTTPHPCFITRFVWNVDIRTGAILERIRWPDALHIRELHGLMHVGSQWTVSADREDPFGNAVWWHCQVLIFGLTLLNCKNVHAREEPCSPKLAKRYQERHGHKRPRYYVLDIEPMRQRFRDANGGKDGISLAKALHICRGHFKNFDDKPLFGKLKGTYWWQPHVRGSADAGIIEKDYRIKL